MNPGSNVNEPESACEQGGGFYLPISSLWKLGFSFSVPRIEHGLIPSFELVIYSGGGFSNVFPLPQYQEIAVKSYFLRHKPSYTSTQYNNSMKTRGYPDISYVVVR